MARRRLKRPLQPTSEVPPIEAKADGMWFVRRITGATSTKSYLCPGCQQTIAPATPHVVAWPTEKALLSADALDERRHWHTPCWKRRL